jgi:serine/threonine protein kinase
LDAKDNGLRDHESGSRKLYPLDFFLDESFAKSFAELNILPRLNLSGYAISDCKINQLKSRRRKPVIEFKLQLVNIEDNNQRQMSINLIGKYRNDGLLRGVFDLLQELWQKAFCCQDNKYLSICRPIGYFSDHNLMITSKAPGIELGKILLELIKAGSDTNTLTGTTIIETYVLEAAKWLAKLHNVGVVRHARRFSFEMEEAKFGEWSDHLRWLYPNFAEKMRCIFSKVLDKERALDTKSFVLIHGDFNPDNIFFDDLNHITVIDFEQSSIFDPAKDLGYFIAKLQSARTKYKLPLDTDLLQKRFLETYHVTRNSSLSMSETLGRIELFKARSYLQHLHFRYWTCRRNHPPDSTDCKYWMKKAEKCLQ